MSPAARVPAVVFVARRNWYGVAFAVALSAQLVKPWSSHPKPEVVDLADTNWQHVGSVYYFNSGDACRHTAAALTLVGTLPRRCAEEADH